MNKRLFENFIGREVEIFVSPNLPRLSGIITECGDDFVVVGDTVWAYEAILGLRAKTLPPPQSQPRHDNQIQQQTERPEILSCRLNTCNFQLA